MPIDQAYGQVGSGPFESDGGERALLESRRPVVQRRQLARNRWALQKPLRRAVDVRSSSKVEIQTAIVPA